jgi:L-alanine-DL-glutamate epimerase-like enolase superfamily enzyme
MQVTDVTMECYRWKRSTPIRNGRYVYATHGLNVVRVETDDGVTGIGLSGGVQGAEEIGREILMHLKQYVVGQDPFDTERIWDDMWQPKLVGRRGLATRVISGIDIALWDIKGKVSNRPVYKLLGGFADKVPVYIAGGYYEEGKGLKELAAETEESVSMGARAIKMKIGGAAIREDVERVRVVRQAAGADIRVMVDANCAYRYYEAIEIARKIEEFDIFWFEEPVNPDDYQGHKLVSQATIIPIATGENEYTRYGFRDLIENRCVAILQPDALIMGGITEFMKVAALAQAHDLPIAPHGSQDIHVHLASAIPNGLILEYYRGSTDPMWGKTFKGGLEVEGEYVRPPDRPGMGIEPNEEALAPHRVV